jgi:YidC/Oxa1 family membrane protein insertase
MPIFANVIQEAFSPLISVFEAVLVFIHNDVVGGSWGLAIIGLTVVIRLVLFPLFMRQMKAMTELQRHMPELKAIQEKYKEDKQRQQQEMMTFYRENKINPFASCLPLLLQLPVFISLFYMLRSDLKKHICGTSLVEHYNRLHHAAITSVSELSRLHSSYISKTSCESVAPHSGKFLFLPDITNKATGVALVVLILLYVGSQVASTALMSASADPNQRRLMLVLPLFFVLILYSYPAGLLVYWITTNLWTIGQGWVVRRTVGPPAALPGAAGKGMGRRGAGAGQAGAGKAATPGDGAQRADGKGARGEKSSPQPALAGAGSQGAPPPPPRKKKKRSGRRR